MIQLYRMINFDKDNEIYSEHFSLYRHQTFICMQNCALIKKNTPIMTVLFNIHCIGIENH